MMSRFCHAKLTEIVCPLSPSYPMLEDQEMIFDQQFAFFGSMCCMF